MCSGRPERIDIKLRQECSDLNVSRKDSSALWLPDIAIDIFIAATGEHLFVFIIKSITFLLEKRDDIPVHLNGDRYFPPRKFPPGCFPTGRFPS